jgi:hypothetical protein
MSATSGKMFSVGSRFACIYALNANGSPAATDPSAYGGIQLVGSKAFTLTIPDPRKITHVGDDRPLQIDFLPPTEAITGELTVAQENQTAYALLSGTNQVTLGESTAVGIGTSKQGFEPQVGLLLYQQALNDAGVRNWRYALIPRALLYAHPAGFSDAAAEHKFSISPAIVTAHLWETAFGLTTEGFVSAQGIIGQATFKPALVAWLSTTSGTQFSFPSDRLLADTNKISLYVNGVAQTSGFTAATSQITFSTAPGSNKRIVAFYEAS